MIGSMELLLDPILDETYELLISASNYVSSITLLDGENTSIV